jgi:hypothetical protein
MPGELENPNPVVYQIAEVKYTREVFEGKERDEIDSFEVFGKLDGKSKTRSNNL